MASMAERRRAVYERHCAERMAVKERRERKQLLKEANEAEKEERARFVRWSMDRDEAGYLNRKIFRRVSATW